MIKEREMNMNYPGDISLVKEISWIIHMAYKGQTTFI
ncbi:hypothetical protein M472_00120 [Sphingobacterium paucimobilis HER1398]|uniref:Uncharacterized protein n=1 Tax=Sphingobacterium paucimobilis HER1398 TaxID=1346330 RepID=U2IWV2_9SPHI|nr:hypothetical protein M472_00120 [Sphingobacterium paucimobilis HER1398]